jgi:hypothetical protein
LPLEDFFFSLRAVNYAASIELVKAAALSFLCSTPFKGALFTRRFAGCAQLNQFFARPNFFSGFCGLIAQAAQIVGIDQFKF